MAKFSVTRRVGGTAEIEAHRYEKDGSGTRFYDADGGTIASFEDGVIAEVVPAGITFSDVADTAKAK